MLKGSDLKKAAAELNIDKESLRTNIKQAIEASDTRTHTRTFRKTRVALVSALLAILLIVSGMTVYAAIPLVRQFLNRNNSDPSDLGFIADVEYIEIYTAAELDAVRNDLTANYKLMADIVFTAEDYAAGGAFEGGWRPIGDMANPFLGVFNGNGHIIYNLQINNPEGSVGLFGKVGIDSFNKKPNEVLFGKVINLGISGGKIAASVAEGDIHIGVGSIAGIGNYIAGCFSEDILIEVEVNHERPISVGGIVGFANIIDSCYSSAQITVTANEAVSYVNDVVLPYPAVGGIAGEAHSATSSYFMGDIASEPYYYTGEILGIEILTPQILSFSQFDDITNRLRSLGVDEYKIVKINSLYTLFDSNSYDNEEKEIIKQLYQVLMQNFSTLPVDETPGPFCVATLDLKRRERYFIETLLLNLADKEALINEFREQGIKMGMSYCYVIEELKDKGSKIEFRYYDKNSNRVDTLEGFNQNNIWKMKKGLPQLAIFGIKH
ncbi:MAG: hypothetical protein GX303_03470 [Clostridiales bacterium]|nr:hypothetical protein [Clostridiales bacterium]